MGVTQQQLLVESQKASNFWQQVQRLSLSERATQLKVAELSHTQKRMVEENNRQASQMERRLEQTERLASQEQLRMSAKIARMKKLSHLALGVSTKPPAGEAEATLAVANARRNRALLYDQTRRG